ncbi:MAG: hypothetical protein IPK48_13485 [Gammaproteobacteria bacterium]|nr:hypothetical protein [Gammaproteobacteria bacterium]
MALADEQAVRAVLAKYETLICKAVHGGWEDWRALPLGGRLLFPARSRACLVYDFIVQRATAAFTDDQAVRVLRRDETAKFVFTDSVVLRFKKANDKGLGSNIQTQATLGFVDQQYELPGLPNVHKVEVVYVLNRLQTQIKQVLVAARDGNVCLWNYVLAHEATAEIIPLPGTVPSDADRAARVKLRVTDEGKKKEISED